MSLSSLSIRRPVFATVMSFTIVMLGILSFNTLGVREFPAIDPPVITILTIYRGASAKIIESQITEPIEAVVNAVAGIDTLTSTSREGASQIRIQFGLDVDIEAAANDVRDQLGRASRNLPTDADPPVVLKSDADSSSFFAVVVSSNSRNLMDLTAYAESMRERLQTVPGVSRIRLAGERTYSMRLWMNPIQLAAYGLTPLDIRRVLQRENVELPSGRIEGSSVELSVRTLSRLSTPEEFNSIVVKRDGDRIVRFSDVGYAEIAPQNLRTSLKYGLEPMIGLYVSPQPGANQVEIADKLNERLEWMLRDKPEDIQFQLAYDNTNFVRQAISEVKETVVVAFILVVLVIFFFLRDWRSTLIPILAIPVSIIGAFLIINAVGFSINVLTLLGVVLAIGLVVDDAIVVLENIYSKIEQGLSPIDAGIEGSREIFMAVVATTIALVVVFMPIIFIGGLTGKLFREFGVVIAGAVLVSSFVALTLTPMLCVRLLKPNAKHSWFYNVTEPFFTGLNKGFEISVRPFLKYPGLALIILVAAFATIYFALKNIPSELSPLEDRGQLTIRSTGPEGASYDYMVNYMDDVSAILYEKVGASINVTMTQVPSGGYGGTGAANNGRVRIFLTDDAERPLSQKEIAAIIQPELRKLSGARSSISQSPTIGSGRSSAGLAAEIVLQASTIEEISDVLDLFLAAAEKRPEFDFVREDLKFNQPQLSVSIDRDKAQNLGITAEDIASTLQASLSGQRFGYFIFDGKQYSVIGQLEREDRAKTSDLKSIFVPAQNGEVIPLSNLITVEETSGPPQLYRFNRYAAATISGNIAPGYTLGQGVEAMQQVAAEVLDERFTTELTGNSREFAQSSSSLGFIFALALALVYLVLSAQFESFRHPFTIMLSVPLALAGAFLALILFDQTINLFSQIGLIMLIGLVTKNGILLVEFANQRRAAGQDTKSAMAQAVASRFRPILMTSVSTMLGTLPLAMATGAGAESRASLGIAVVGGLITGTALTLYVIPALYLLIAPRDKPAVTEDADTSVITNPDPANVELVHSK
jgi:multidrug efflux pump